MKDLKDNVKKLNDEELKKVNGGIVLGKGISAHGIDSYSPGTILAYADSIDDYTPHLVKLLEINGVCITVQAFGFWSELWFREHYCKWALFVHTGSADISLADYDNNIYKIGYDIFSSNKFYEVDDYDIHDIDLTLGH